jgi:hypothetical protein
LGNCLKCSAWYGRPRRRTPPNHSFDAFGSSKDTAVTEQTLYFATGRISNWWLSSRSSIEIPAVGHITGKNIDGAAYAIGFRNRLLVIRLSVLAEPCQVLFLLCILFFNARGLCP